MRNKQSNFIYLILLSLFLLSIFYRTDSFAVTPGNIDGINEIDLRDALLALQVCAGMNPNIDIQADIDFNQRIGLAEAIYILKFVANTCDYTIKPEKTILTSKGGEGSISVTTTNGCSWNAINSDNWINITSASNDGSGTILYSVAPNSTTDPRVGTITISSDQTNNSPQKFLITQTGNDGGECTYILSHSTAFFYSPGGKSGITVFTQNGCSWEAFSDESWIDVEYINFDASGIVTYSVSENFNDSIRTGIITAAGNIFVVTQNGKNDQEVEFPDPNLEAVIRKKISSSSGAILTSDLEKITKLLAGEKNIVNLEGLQYCTNLEELHLDGNPINDLNPIASLTSLESLFLGNCQLTNIDKLSSLTSLSALWLGDNQISDISSLSMLTALGGLYLNNNQISDISPISNLSSLIGVWLNNNKISDISPISNLSSLANINLLENPLSDTSCNTYIPLLIDRGITVVYSCP